MFGLSEEKRKDITLIVCILAFVFSTIIGIFALSNNYRITDLADEQNEFSRISTELQSNQTAINEDLRDLQFEVHEIVNFNTTIHGDVSSFYLESFQFQLYENSSIRSIIMRGNLSTTFQIASPHVTEFNIQIKNFSKPWWIFRKECEGYTDVKFVYSPEPILIEPEVNIVEIDYPLACVYYPIDYLIPEPGQFEHFLFGEIYFEIILTDIQTGDEIVHSFKSDIIGKIIMPDQW